MDRVDCRVFEDQLDALVRGDLPDAGKAQLRGHAAVCPECAAMLRVKEHLVSPGLEALEVQVPQAYVASMWGEVQGALARTRRGEARRGRWTIPALAAATVVLLLANGLAVRRLGRAEERARVLTEQVLDQQRRLVAQESAGPGRRGRSGLVAGFTGRNTPLGSLEGREDVTVDDLRALLADLPGETPLLSASRARALAGSRRVPQAWRDALSDVDAGRDVTAEDLLRVLETLGLPGTATVPTERLFELLS